MFGHALKFGRIRSRGFGVMGFKFRSVRITPKFSAPPSGVTMRRRRTCFGGARKVRTSSITTPSLVGLKYRAPPGAKKFEVYFPAVLRAVDSIGISVT